jgi:Protein of unknown function (DUF4087)
MSMLMSALMLILDPNPSLASDDGVLLCGWFENPTPGNAWLHDRSGEWTIAVQGGAQAEGKWPEFEDSQWIQTGSGSSGYGCACLRARTKPASRDIIAILSTTVKPLAVCRRDKALTEPKNPAK